MKLILILLVSLFILSPKIVFAELSIGLSGFILDGANNPVPKGKLTFTNESNQEVTSTVADTNGYYEIGMTEGVYQSI